MGDVNKAEVRDLLVNLFGSDPQGLQMWAATIETFPGLNGLVAGTAWTNAMSSAFGLVNAIDARGGFTHAETRARIAKTLTHANPLRVAEIEATFGITTEESVSVVDRDPLDYAEADARELRDLFAIGYRSRAAIDTLLQEAGVPLGDVAADGSPRERWTSALRVAAERKRLRKLVDLAQQQRPNLRERLVALAGGEAVLSADSVPDDAADSVPDWKGGGDEGIERILAENSTLLDLAFLRRGIEVATSVVHITTHFGMKSFMGTAFRVGPRHLLTNHHNVFLGRADPYRALDRMTVRIGYEVRLNGQTDDGVAIEEAQPEILMSERSKAPARDWALVRLGQPLPEAVGTVDITRTTPPEPDDRAYIIQHPKGLAKKIGLNRNLIRSVDGDVIQYLTDTASGSSGSPVFNARWELIGLHYRYIASQDEERFGYRNQGMRVEPILQALREASISLTD